MTMPFSLLTTNPQIILPVARCDNHTMNEQAQLHNDISSEEAELCRQIEEAAREQELCVERRTALQAAIAAKTSSKSEAVVASPLLEKANGAEQEQREIEELNEKCQSLYHLLKLWRGQQLLHRLKRNDPETALVDSAKLPHGHGQALGEALQHNTVVQAWDLNLRQAFPPNEDESNSNSSDGSDANLVQWGPLLNFLQTSTSLINLRVVKGGLPLSSQYTWNLCASILNVLSNNVHLEKLSWDALCCPNALVKLLANSHNSALRDLNIVFCRQIPELEQQVIASAFGTQQQQQQQQQQQYGGACHLQSLQLEVDGRENLVRQILTNLQHHVPTLQRLALKGNDNIYFFEPPNDEENDSDNPERNAVFDALSQYLQSPTCVLDRLELGPFTMGQSNMSKILSGMKRTTTSSSDRTRGSDVVTTTLSVLVFMDITFDAAAFDELTAFLQTRTTNGSGDIVHESHLRELHIEYMEGSPLPSRMSKQLAISMLTAVDTNDNSGGSSEAPSKSRTVDLPTVGSQIHTLRLSYAHSSFLRHLGQNADRVRLKELQLFAVDGPDTRHLSKCLSRLPYLPKLKIRSASDRTARRLILQGLKNNGSIGYFSLSSTSWESPLLDQSLHPLVGYSSDDEDEEEYDKFNESESRLIAAYGYRNKVLGTLLETGRYETTAVAALDDGDGHQVSSNNDNCTAACTSPFDQADPISVSGIHYPLLMKTTMDVPRSCLGMVTRGLLKLDDTIGQDGSSSSSGAKRKASDCD